MDSIEEYHKRNSKLFCDLYPELKDIKIYITRHDSYGDHGHMSNMPISKNGFLGGRYVKCSNSKCNGKYDLHYHIREAIDNKKEKIDIINIGCPGKITTEKYCERSTSTHINLIYHR